MVGKKIAKLRRARGWTQKDLANATRLSRGYIASIEEGRNPGVKAISLIAKALEVNASDLYKKGR